MKRRTVLKSGVTALAAAAVPFQSVRAGSATATPQLTELTETPLATLKAVAAIVLPSEIGRAGTDEATDRFARWISNYKSNADMDHGYGFTRIRATGPSPLTAYGAQLQALDDHAPRGSTFAALPTDRQREIVTQMLEGVDRLPVRPEGKNVIADLMGFYFHTSEANDLCYRADIGREKCRGLLDSNRAPRHK